MAAGGNTPHRVNVLWLRCSLLLGNSESVRCSDVDQHWLIVKQPQIAIFVFLILPKLVIEEILL